MASLEGNAGVVSHSAAAETQFYSKKVQIKYLFKMFVLLQSLALCTSYDPKESNSTYVCSVCPLSSTSWLKEEASGIFQMFVIRKLTKV